MPPHLVKHCKIKGAPWKICVLDSPHYKKRHGDDSEGITLRQEKTIHIDRVHFCLATLKHELFHAYITECYGHMLDLSGEQMEELSCEVASYYSEIITKIAEDTLVLLTPKLEKKFGKV